MMTPTQEQRARQLALSSQFGQDFKNVLNELDELRDTLHALAFPLGRIMNQKGTPKPGSLWTRNVPDDQTRYVVLTIANAMSTNWDAFPPTVVFHTQGEPAKIWSCPLTRWNVRMRRLE